MGVFISDDEMHALLFPEDPEPAADAAKKEGQEAERKEEVVTTPTTAKPKTKLTRASRKMYALIIGALPESTSKFIVGTAEGDGLAVWQQLSQEYERSKPACWRKFSISNSCEKRLFKRTSQRTQPCGTTSLPQSKLHDPESNP